MLRKKSAYKVLYCESISRKYLWDTRQFPWGIFCVLGVVTRLFACKVTEPDTHTHTKKKNKEEEEKEEGRRRRKKRRKGRISLSFCIIT